MQGQCICQTTPRDSGRSTRCTPPGTHLRCCNLSQILLAQAWVAEALAEPLEAVVRRDGVLTGGPSPHLPPCPFPQVSDPETQESFLRSYTTYLVTVGSRGWSVRRRFRWLARAFAPLCPRLWVGVRTVWM